MLSGEEIRKNISKNIVKYREKAGFSQKELAQKLNTTSSRVSNWEQGSNCPTIDILFEVCKVLDVSINDIYGVYPDSEIILSYDEQNHIKKYRFITEHSPDGAKMVDSVLDREYDIAEKFKGQKEYIKELNGSPSQDTFPTKRLINYYYRLASAGSGQIVFDTPPTKRIEIPDIPEYRKADYAIGVNGNSMEPVFHDGDTLLIEMTEEIEIGEIGIFLVDGESYVKKLGNEELISLNSKCENVPLTENSKCLGRVIATLLNN